MKQYTEILNNIAMIQLNINLWAGDKALKAEDLAANGVDVSMLPPGKLAHLGSKKTINKNDLKGFIALKREAHAACSRVGVKFGGGGYAIPIYKLEEVCAALDILKDEFAEGKVNFIHEYPDMIEAWVNENDPTWQTAIRKCADPVSVVKNTMSFNFSSFTVNPVGSRNGLEEEIGGLHGQLCKEVRMLAKNTLNSSYIGKTSAGKRALRPVQAILTKLEGLWFLDDSIQSLSIDLTFTINNAFDCIKYDPENEFKNTPFNEVVAMLTQLSNLGIKTVYEEAADLYEEPEEETVVLPATPVATSRVAWDF
jgi:hypothetical protein